MARHASSYKNYVGYAALQWFLLEIKLEQIKKVENNNGVKFQDGKKDLYNLSNTRTKDCLCVWNGMVLERDTAAMSIN